MNDTALLIAGPTAGGKSRAALELARAFDGMIINTDSMQVYRDLRVLSARPSPEDERRAPHALYGVLDGADPCSAGRWGEMAAAALETARESGRVPIFTGGTGLYFSTLTEGLSAMPEIPPPVRSRVRAQIAETGPEPAHAELARRDPESAAALRPGDRQRVARALELLEATGRGLAYWQKAAGAPVLNSWRWSGLVLAPPRAELHARCAARFDAMMSAGALEEVSVLAARALDPALPVMKAVGVRPLLAHLEGRISQEEAVRAVQTDTRRYVKRQMTWLRGRMGPPWTWLSAAYPEEVSRAVHEWAVNSLSGR